MKKIIFLASIAMLCLVACRKEMVQPAGASQKEIAPSYTEYNIFKGKQYCDKNIYVPVATKVLSFRVKFDSSAIYTTASTENQTDINKLFGFSDNNAMHHEYSARFGWRWSDHALRLFAYVYNAGARSSKELGTVDIGTENNCSITVSGDEYVFDLNGNKTSMPRKSTTPEAEGYQLYPYFGGDEAAPHNISIWIEKL